MSINLHDLPLETMPILTDKDIRTYNWQEHVLTLKQGFSLLEKLGKVPTSGRPFVVIADSERIYLGSFWTPISSLYIPGIPTITIWLSPKDNEVYTITYGNEPEDPRDDQRIYKSLKLLGKIAYQ